MGDFFLGPHSFRPLCWGNLHFPGSALSASRLTGGTFLTAGLCRSGFTGIALLSLARFFGFNYFIIFGKASQVLEELTYFPASVRFPL